MCIFRHSFYCCYKHLPLHWAFAILWSFPFFFNFLFFSLFYNFNFQAIIFFLHLCLCVPFLPFFSPCSKSLMYINLLYLPLFSFAYLFFLSFLSFLSSQLICQFCFHCFIPQMAPCFSFVFQFVLQLVLFLTGRYTFWFPFFTWSVYCTLFLLDCFDFAHGCISICIYSILLIIIYLIL